MAALKTQNMQIWILVLGVILGIVLAATSSEALNLGDSEFGGDISHLEDLQEDEKRQLYYPGGFNWKKLWTKKGDRPWEKLPDTRCYRKKCSSSDDCCRRYNICDPYVKICYDCWYKYPCSTDADCCQKYPNCKRGNCYS